MGEHRMGISITFVLVILFLVGLFFATAEQPAESASLEISPTARPTPGPIPTLETPPYYIPQALDNPGFESAGWHRGTAFYFYNNPVLQHVQFGEITVPEDWVAVWFDGYPSHQHGAPTGRPEMLVVDLSAGFPDAERVKSGNRALKAFTFWRPNHMGIAQQVRASDLNYWVNVYIMAEAWHGLKHADLYVDDVSLEFWDGHFILEAFAHTWYSGCSAYPHLGHPGYIDRETGDCLDASDWTHMEIRLGLEIVELGEEIDPASPDIVWSEPFEQYGVYADDPFVLEVWREVQHLPILFK